MDQHHVRAVEHDAQDETVAVVVRARSSGSKQRIEARESGVRRAPVRGFQVGAAPTLPRLVDGHRTPVCEQLESPRF